ncbi:MAG: aminoacyl-tRNA hydrolase [Spirochaetia bacterium]|jgi:ribosome-associated protein|nr:aminoacyl-tRNA hydrolase [Spirochaetia bacterium]
MDPLLFTASLYREVGFAFSRSSGAGGQNVNKVNTKVTACVAVDRLQGLSKEEMALVKNRLAGRLSGEGLLCVTAQDTRSQTRNRELALQRLEALLHGARHIRAKRRATRPTQASRRARLESKKRQSLKKSARKRPGGEFYQLDLEGMLQPRMHGRVSRRS